METTTRNSPSNARYQRVVVKLGTSVLTEGSHALNQARIQDLARQIALLQRAGHEVLVVSSGAKAAGLERLGIDPAASHGGTRQMLSAIGQSRIMWYWERHFAERDMRVGQILLTRMEIEDPTSYLNIQDTMNALIGHGIVPVINENDVIATPRVRVGDNDSISAMVAVMMHADLLLLLTDQEGLYTRDPRLHPDAELIKVVPRIDDAIYAQASGSSTHLGTGGMKTKLDAAMVAQRAGIDVIVTAGRRTDVLLRVVRDRMPLGTLFPGTENFLENRKKRILTGVAAGTVVVDAGARNALVNRGTSLLAAGITRVQGHFDRGAMVSVSLDGRQGFARGIVRYAGQEMERIKGCQSSEISQILGYDYGDEIIHRNDLILL